MENTTQSRLVLRIWRIPAEAATTIAGQSGGSKLVVHLRNRGRNRDSTHCVPRKTTLTPNLPGYTASEPGLRCTGLPIQVHGLQTR